MMIKDTEVDEGVWHDTCSRLVGGSRVLTDLGLRLEFMFNQGRLNCNGGFWVHVWSVQSMAVSMSFVFQGAESSQFSWWVLFQWEGSPWFSWWVLCVNEEVTSWLSRWVLCVSEKEVIVFFYEFVFLWEGSPRFSWWVLYFCEKDVHDYLDEFCVSVRRGYMTVVVSFVFQWKGGIWWAR